MGSDNSYEIYSAGHQFSRTLKDSRNISEATYLNGSKSHHILFTKQIWFVVDTML